MRCPKCRYIGFEETDRCRNCGYSFAMAAAADAPDLPIKAPDEPIGPLGDLALSAGAAERREPEVPPDPGRAGRRQITPEDLPLFLDRAARHDAPLVTASPTPRAPLAVRRSNAAPKAKGREWEPDEPMLDLDAPDPQPLPSRSRVPIVEPPTPPLADERVRTAGLFPRLAAGLIDLLIVGSIQAAVVYLTLRVCGLQVEQIGVLAPAPLIAFLLLLAGGYFTSFVAAGGQTIGKMIAGIRVVPTPEADRGSGRVPFGNAVVRAAASAVSLLPAGAGLVPALFSPDRRALHDRLADTRVVKG